MESMARRHRTQHPTGGTALRAHLVSAGSANTPGRSWPEQVRAVLDPSSGHAEPLGARAAWAPYLVHGGPGTGKTSLIVDAAVARLCDPAVDPESVLVLAAGRRSATALREEITRRVLAVNPGESQSDSTRARAHREPLVRTVHSYAFAVLRLQASAHGNPPPRLITGSEQDVVLRELLAGDVDDGAAYWPPSLRPALPTDGFAQALRDLIMRAAERGVGPDDLAELGRRHGRPEWVAAGHAFAQYEHIMLLRGAVGLDAPTASAPAVDAAELVGSALSAFATDPELLAAQRKRIRHLLVDDAQHLDPQAAELITLIGTGTESTVIAADTDQSIYGFRGASPRFAESLVEPGSDRDILLDNDFRGTGQINAVGRRLAARLPGARPHPYPDAAGAPDSGSASDDAGSVSVQVFGSSAKEATAIADLFRRAHLFDQIPWSEMAMVVRSVSLMLPALRRACRSAGVPLSTPTTDIPLHRQRAVLALMLALRVVAARSGGVTAERELESGDVLTLLSGPIGGADPASLRRLRRGVRRSAERTDHADVDSLAQLRSAILDPAVAKRLLADLTDTEAAPLRRVLDVIDKAHTAHRATRGVEETLWAAWQATGLDRRWAASALRGGPTGEQADRDLDAVIAMFEAAADFTDNLPGSGPDDFVHYLSQLQIPRESRAAVARSDSVTLLSAHAAAGREWEVVAVGGVLDGVWPSLRSRGSVLRTAELVDLLDGVEPDVVDVVSRSAGLLAEERRLLLVACTRARRRLLVTAVEDGSGDASPSRFVAEIADLVESAGDESPADADESLPVHPGIDRVLSLPSLVATLRAAVIGADGTTRPDHGRSGTAQPDERARAAADLLAQLADSDIPGAHPRDWFGLAGPSTDVALWSTDRGPVVLSPSNVESLTRCPLRWMLERHGGRDGDATPAVTGTLVHTLVQAVAGEIDPAEVADALRAIWDRVDTGADWFSRRELERAEGMLIHFGDWLRSSRDELTTVAVEADIVAELPAPAEPEADDLPVRLRGRIDRLETDSAGRPVVVDVKTGKTATSKHDAEQHAQLASYQLGIALGGLADLGMPAGTEPGGGRLVYVANAHRTTGAAEREQPPLTPEQVDEWIGIVRKAARATVGPQFEATPNPGCQHCALATSCPARLPGKAVTDD